VAFIHNIDFESFQRFLGCNGPEDVPEKYAREYSLRLSMFHKDGNSGPLGSLGVIECLRYCGFTPEFAVEKPAEIDWDTIKRGQRVEARFNGAWLAGEFLGFGQHRVLLVQLDEIEEVKECGRHMVRLSDKPKPPPAPVVDEPLPPAEADLLPQEPTDWTQVAAGEEVWVEGDELKEGKFIKAKKKGTVLVVMIDEQQHEVPADKVTRAAMVG